jgi:hypothetical protein
MAGSGRLQIVDARYLQLLSLAAAHASFKAQFAMAVKSRVADIGPTLEVLPLDAARVMNGLFASRDLCDAAKRDRVSRREQ